MANKKITYTLELDAEIKDLESKLNKTKSSLDSIFKSGQAPAGLEKAFERLEGLFDRIKDKAKSPIDSKSGFTSIGKDVDSVNQSLNALSRILSEIASKGTDNFALLPKDTQAQITAIVKSIEDYGAAVQASTVETKELVAAREALAKATAKVQDAQANVNTKSALYEQAKQERDALQAQIDVIKERQKALKEAKTEQAKVDSFYSKPGEDGKPRDRRRKYEGVSSTPAQAKAKTDALIAASAGDEAELASLTEQLKRTKKDVESYNTQLGTANRTLREANTAAEQAQESFNRLNDAFQSGSEQKKQKAFDELKQKAKELGVEIDDIGDAFSQEDANTLIKRLNNVSNKAFEQFADNAKEAADAVDELGENTKRVKGKLEDGTEALQNMTDAASQREAFEGKIKQFLGLSGAAQVLRSALRDAMATITELDATMTEMAVVTDLTVGDYWDQLPEYSKQASELGVSINSAYKAATLYYQQGLKGNEVTKISAETLKLAKIAGIDAAEATNKMTAALRGFNMELNEASAQKVADVYSELAAITAADVDEISNAMTKTASIASSAGMEFETTAAFLSQIIETTRESAETAGTALKTVIARFQELKKDPSEIGEIDGEIVDANKIETALRSVGVALRDSSGQFRDLDDVFMDLSKKWDGLDKNTQRYIATIAAGSRQQSRFIAMMSDYGRTQELVSAANNSAGASNKQFEKTMDSLEAKLEKLKNAWHEFTMGIMESDLVKFGVDILTKFLEVVNKATSGFDGLGGSLVKIVSIFGIFKLGSKIFEKIKQPLIGFFADVVKMSRVEGEKAGKAFDEGARKGGTDSASTTPAKKLGFGAKLPNGYKIDENGKMHDEKGKFVSDTERDAIIREANGAGVKTKLSNTGIISGAKALGKKGAVGQARAELAKLKSQGTKKDRQTNYDKALDAYTAAKKGGNAAEIEKTKKAADDARASVEEYGNAEQKVKDESTKAWSSIGNSLTAAGQAATSVGMAMSMVGGVLSSLGLESAGKVLSTVGNGITMIGSALMAIPPILTAITAHPIIALITLIVGLILGAVVGMMAYLDSISAEAKLEDAQANADAAKEAAEQADEAFRNLNDSLSELDSKYETLDNLTEGTKEWNEAVQDVNASVLDLIDQYPELAGLVENEGGVLKLDIESDEVQDVIKKYEGSAAHAKAVQYSAEARVTQAQQDLDFSNLDAVNEVSKLRGKKAFEETLDTVGEASMGIGMDAGSALLTGATAGAVSAVVANSKTHTDKDLQKATEALALSVQEGVTDMTFEGMEEFLIAQGMAADEAQVMAKTFAQNTESLQDFGKATLQSKAAIEAQYSAMAMQAKQMINLNNYTAEEQEQMSNAINAEKMKEIEETRAKELEAEYQNKSNTDEFDNMKNEYAKEMYGAGARVKNNKILDEAGNVVREFKNEDEFAAAMASSQATKEAAEAMEKMPGIINKGAAVFAKKVEGAGISFEKMFLGSEGNKLTQADVDNLAKITNEDLKEAFNSLSSEEKEVYNNDVNKYMEEFKDRLNQASLSFNNSNKKLDKFNQNIELNGKMSAKAAKAWVDNLETMNMGGATAQELETLDSSLDAILNSGLTAEEAELVMSEINAIDKMDIKAWDELAYTFEELGLMAKISDSALQDFIESGKVAAKAITKINFDTLVNDVRKTYELLDKVKESERTYTEEDYKELIAANKGLKQYFKQIGDKFVYVGGSMETLVDALEENTTALLGQAAWQLKEKMKASNIIQEKEQTGGYTSVEYMNENQRLNYITDMRNALLSSDISIESLGIEGLGDFTDLTTASPEQLKIWAEAIAGVGGSYNLYSKDYTEKLNEALTEKYTRNSASYNAQLASEGGEYADQHKDALILQAVLAGSISNSVLEAYEQAYKDGDKQKVDEIGKQIAEATDRIVEASEGRDATKELIGRVAEVLEQERQAEIDKLSEINDTIVSTNGKLISKIQEQINEDREERQKEETQQSITDLQSQRAYLSIDTSGSNTLELQKLDEQIKEEEQNYQDLLIDQAIQNLQDANEQAAQQRNDQIDLLQRQLDWEVENGNLTREAEAIVEESLNRINEGIEPLDTTLGKLLWGSEGKNLSSLEEQEWASSLTAMSIMAANWFASQGIPVENFTGNDGVDTINGNGGGGQAAINAGKRGAAIANAKKVLSDNKIQNRSAAEKNTDVQKYLEEYQAAGGTNVEEFWSALEGHYSKYSASEGAVPASAAGFNNEEDAWFDVKVASATDNQVETGRKASEQSKLSELWNATKTDDMSDDEYHVVITNRGVGDQLYIREGVDGTWYEILDQGADLSSTASKRPSGLIEAAKKYRLSKYETGGLADFTGPAWLDGTKARPEYVLNADQTERFFSFVDVLEGFDNNGSTTEKGGDNYFNIQIDVEKLENDYDIEQMANKIRRMIYEDATYRNVNTINLIR